MDGRKPLEYMSECDEITKEVAEIDLHYSNANSQTMLIRKR